MIVQILALGQKMALIWGSIVLHRLIKGNGKIFLSEATGPRALIFGM